MDSVEVKWVSESKLKSLIKEYEKLEVFFDKVIQNEILIVPDCDEENGIF